MSAKDSMAKEYFADNARFADLCNNILYGGREVILPENLKERDTTEVLTALGLDKKTIAMQKMRDIFKNASIKYTGKSYVVLIGVENQSDIHYAIPVKNMFYDVMAYGNQVKETAKKHRKEKDTATSDEFLSGFTKEDKLIPVITITVYLGTAASIYTAGNYSIYDGSNLSLLKGIADGVDMDAQSDALQHTYTALNSKLLTNYADLPTNAASVSLFTNIVNNTNLLKIVPNSGNKHIFETEYQGKKYQAIVKNGNYTYDANDKSHNVDIIVATGDVTLNADFTGTIVAKGRIIVNKDQCEIDNGTQEVFKALLLEKVSDADDALHLYDVFMDGANYLGNVSSFSNKKEADTKIDYATLITYQNWTKE